MPRFALVALATVVVLTACSGGDDADSPDGSSPSPSSPQELAVAPLAVIGNGRAISAASATGDQGVVVTTTGVTTIDTAGQPQTLPSELDLASAAVAMSPDGRAASIVSKSLGAEIWSVEGTPTVLHRFDGAIEAAFASDNRTAIVTSSGEVVSAPIDGTAPTSLIVPSAGGQIVDSSATASGAMVAAALRGSQSGADLTIYRPEAGVTVIDAFSEPGWEITRVEVNDPGDRLVVAVVPGDPFGGVLAGVDAASGAVAWQVDVGPLATEGMWDVGADGRTLVARNASIELIALDGSIASEQELDPALPVTSVVATQSGYAIGFADGSIRFTDLDVQTVGEFASVGVPLTSVQPLAGSDGVIAVDAVGVIRLWDGAGTLLSESSSFRATAVNDVDVSPDGASIAYGTSGGDAFVSDILGATPPQALVHPEGNVESVSFSTAGSTLLTGVADRLGDDMSFNDTISLWNLVDDQRYFTAGGQGMVDGMATFRSVAEFSPAGDVFASTALDFSVSLRGAEDGALVHTFPAGTSAVLDLAFSPTGDRLVVSSDAGTIQLWSTDDFALLAEYAAPPGGYWSVAFMPDGERLVVSDLTGAVSMIAVADGTPSMAFEGTKSRSSDIGVSPDGALAAAGTDGTDVRIWSTSTGKVVADIAGHTEPVTSTTFTPDGSTLVSGSQDSTVRVWSLG